MDVGAPSELNTNGRGGPWRPVRGRPTALDSVLIAAYQPECRRNRPSPQALPPISAVSCRNPWAPEGCLFVAPANHDLDG